MNFLSSACITFLISVNFSTMVFTIEDSLSLSAKSTSNLTSSAVKVESLDMQVEMVENQTLSPAPFSNVSDFDSVLEDQTETVTTGIPFDEDKNVDSYSNSSVLDPETGLRLSIKDCIPGDHVFHNFMMQDCASYCSASVKSGDLSCSNIIRLRFLFCTCPRYNLDRTNCYRASRSSASANNCDSHTTYKTSLCMKACRMVGRTAYICPPKMTSGPFPILCVCSNNKQSQNPKAQSSSSTKDKSQS